MSDDSFKTACYLIAGGSIFFYTGLRNSKLRRKIEDIPRSKISSAAIGEFVEISGKVYGSENCEITSPLTQEKGLAFIWDLQKLVGSGKHRHWETIHTFYSTPYIYLQDDKQEDLAALDLSSCEFQEELFESEVDFDNSNYLLPHKVKELFEDQGMLEFKEKSFWTGSSQYRLREKIFRPGEIFFVLGTTVSPPAKEIPFNPEKTHRFGTRNQALMEEIQSIYGVARKEKEIITHYDQNKNLKLDTLEEKKLFNDIEQKILDSYQLSSVNELLDKSKICFTASRNNDDFFDISKVIVSKRSEGRLLKDLRNYNQLCIVGGPLMVVAGLWYLLNGK